jgi:hypothetical protein
MDLTDADLEQFAEQIGGKSTRPSRSMWPPGRMPVSSIGGSKSAGHGWNGSVAYRGADGRQRWIKAVDLRPAAN